MNNVILTGYITKDIELRYTKDQNAVCNFTLAVARETQRDNADFPRISVFGKTAENLCKFCGKSSRIAVIGKLRTSTYEDAQGETQKITEVLADRIEFLSRKEETQDDEY